MFYGIGIYQPKHDCNVGTLFRSAHCMGANFVFTVGKRKYVRQASDTTNATLSLPYYHYTSLAELEENLPKASRLICIENYVSSKPLESFCHPKQAVYLLGNEVYGLPEELVKKHLSVKINSSQCLNVSTAGSIVIYDRNAKLNTK